MKEQTVFERLTDSDCVVTFTKGEEWGTMLATFVKTPLGISFKTVVPKERVLDEEYPWIQSVLAEIYQTKFGTRIKRTDITTVIALEEGITMGITVGNENETLVIESPEYAETAEELGMPIH